jgi:hypothetical protein
VEPREVGLLDVTQCPHPEPREVEHHVRCRREVQRGIRGELNPVDKACVWTYG